MRSFDVCIRPVGAALLLGGQSGPQRGGDRATARDHRGQLVIPASALRGALRIELERLLAGREGGPRACSANRAEPADPDNPCCCPVCRLFGDSGSSMGTLRLEDASPTESGQSPAPTVVRSRVAISRRTRTAADRLLSFSETSDRLDGEQVFRAPARLVGRGPSDSEENLVEDLGYLRAACAALRAIGGGRARGFGWVECSLEERSVPQPARSSGDDLSTAEELELRFEAQAPLHFGEGRQIAFFQPSLRFAPGSAVRGAVAFALLEAGLCTADDPGFQELFGPAARVTFGSARAAGDVPAATRRRCRNADHVFDDLVAEVLRREAARCGLALAWRPEAACPVPGCTADKLLPWPFRDGAGRPMRRVRTRTTLNRRTGTSMDRKLYSVEALEPQVSAPGGAAGRQPLVLSARVSGLGPASARRLAELDGREVWLGGKRSKGMGRCTLRLTRPSPRSLDKVGAEIAALATAFATGWDSLRQVAGDLWPVRWLAEEEVPLVLVLAEPWCPGGAGEDSRESLAVGPLLVGESEPGSVRLLTAFLEIAEEGRFSANEARQYGAPAGQSGEVPPLEVAAAGSTFVYAVSREGLAGRLEKWIATGNRGQGLHPEIGWGRFLIRGLGEQTGGGLMATQDSSTARTRKSALDPHKAWLVERGNAIGETARKNSEWVSQARGLWEAARHETEPTVLLNLLDYQRARNKNWTKPQDVFTPLRTAMLECIEERGQGDRALALDLIRHLLVYTIRSHVYHRELAREEAKEPKNEQGPA